MTRRRSGNKIAAAIEDHIERTRRRAGRSRAGIFEVIGEIDSTSEPGILHLIKRRVSTGTLSCDCMAWRFSRGEKHCKHVDAYKTAGLRDLISNAATQILGTSDDPASVGAVPVMEPAPAFTEEAMPRPGVRRLRLRE